MRKRCLLTIPLVLMACEKDDRRGRLRMNQGGLRITTMSLGAGMVGAPYEAAIAASGGTRSSYEWSVNSGTLPNGLSIGVTGTPTTSISGIPGSEGLFTFTVQVADSDGNTAQREFSVRIEPRDPDALDILTMTLPGGQLGTEYMATLAAVNGSRMGYRWTVEGGALPPGVTLTAEGTPSTTLAGTPTAQGTFEVDIRVTDSDGGTAQRRFTITIVPMQAGLRIITTQLPRGQVDMPYRASIEATGVGTGYAWSVIRGPLPAGLTIGNTGGPVVLISGTPTASGSFPITVRVMRNQASVERQFTVEVDPVMVTPLRITTAQLPGGMIGIPYDQMITAEGGSTNGYRWSIAAGLLPPGLSMAGMGTPSTRLRGTPTFEGTYDFEVQVRDSAGATARQRLMVVIAAMPTTVTIVTNMVAGGIVGRPYSEDITSVMGQGTHTWSVSQGNLPPGLMLQPTTGAVVTLSGTPTAMGTFNFTIRVEDMADNDEQVFSVQVIPTPPPLRITTMTIVDGQQGQAYQAQLTATGGTMMQYTWALAGGALPQGLTLQPGGTPSTVIAGTPQRPDTFTATISVTDSGMDRDTRAFTFRVNPAPLTINTPTLPDTVLGTTYSRRIEAFGGTGAGYQWDVSQGTLPPGLMLGATGTPDTTLAGISTMNGRYAFTLRVRDSGGAEATRPYVVVVSSIPVTVNLPLNLNDSLNFLWDIQRDGNIQNGTADAYDGGHRLRVNNTSFQSFTTGNAEANGREVALGPQTIGNLRVTRKIFVPMNAAFARFLEIIENTSATPEMATVRIDTNLGSDGSTQLVGTSSGDTMFTPVDDWIVTDDTNGAGDPTITHVISGPNAHVEPDAVAAPTGLVNYSYTTMVPAMGRIIIMHFGTQRQNRAMALADVATLVTLAGNELDDMSANETTAVVNFRAFPDSDNDGLDDMREMMLGTNPNDPDTDNDGLLDGYEVTHGFNPLVPGEQLLDGDNDGLDNLAEQAARTNPAVADTDMDLLNDGLEINTHMTDPLRADTDMDGLNDGAEILTHTTSATIADTDGGGRTDGQEVLNDMTNPLDPSDDLNLVPLTARINDGNNFLWDIQGTGSIINGSSDAYDGGLRLFIDTQQFPSFTMAVAEDAGRELSIGPAMMGNLSVSRKIFIPQTDAFARFLEILDNTTTATVTVTVRLATNLGSDGGTNLIATSSGDMIFDAMDDWLITDDTNGQRDPTMVHVFSGAGARMNPTATSLVRDNVEYSYRVSVPPMGRVIVMHFASQNMNQMIAATSAGQLFTLMGQTRDGMSAGERAAVVTFNVP